MAQVVPPMSVTGTVVWTLLPAHPALVRVGFPAVSPPRLRDPASWDLAVGRFPGLGSPHFSTFPLSCLPSETGMELAAARVKVLGPHCHSQWGLMHF